MREFAPALLLVLVPGDKLDFQLRCKATRTKRDGKRGDIVMDALHTIPKAQRAEQRMELTKTTGQAWLARQGAKAGFSLISAQAVDYSAQILTGHCGPRKGQPQFGILDHFGRIEVTDPAVFLGHLPLGFGRAKAFGCGLMLIRRAT